MSFLGLYTEQEVVALLAASLKKNDASTQHKAPPLIPYITTETGREANKRFKKIEKEKDPRAQAFLLVTFLREIHKHYDEQYYALASKYEQLFTINSLVDEVRKLREGVSK